MNNQNKKQAPVKTETRKKCIECKGNAELQNDDGSWICDNCAQEMSELGNEISIEN
jgi:ribosomal protein L37AE/L43A